MPDRAAPAGTAPATETEIEVTPEMIEAGMAAYYAIRRYPGDEPFNEEAAILVYRAMVRPSCPL
jgi:hypothetical protein